MKRYFILLTLLLAIAVPAVAQSGVFVSRAHPLAGLPALPKGISVVDSQLYVYDAEVLLKALRHGDELVGFSPDTDFIKHDEGITYVVRHPSTGDLYFTRLDRKGRSCLYYSYRDGKRTKTKRLKMDDIEVEHPTFSADGKVMVFASVERRRSYGGYDLWYSQLTEGEWSMPVNLGNRVNSQGDDVTPCIVGDYLFFSSNGRDENRNHLNIYATRLIARQVTGDTVGMLQIGRSRVQPLPQGINSAVSDCFDFAIDTLRRCCYWVNSASGIRSYSGPLDAVSLWGHTYDSKGRPLAGVKVTVYDGGQPVAMAASAADGFYRLTLPVGPTYRLHFCSPRRFSQQFQLPTRLDAAGNLIGEVLRDVTLDSLPVRRPILYTDLFGPDAVVDLSAHGIETLAPLVTFLTDNPNLQADLTLSCDLLADAEFNALLAEKRMQQLKTWLLEQLPEGSKLTFHSKGGSDATGEAKLTVILK